MYTWIEFIEFTKQQITLQIEIVRFDLEDT